MKKYDSCVKILGKEKSKELFLDFEQNRSPNGQSVNNII